MDKSYNDIKAQEQRVIATATELGRYRDNKRRCVDIQRIAQITRNTLCQHGIGFFGYDPNEKKPRKIIEQPKAEPERPRLEEKRAAGVETQTPTPTQKAESRMALVDWMAADEANRKKIADIARHQFIKKMYAELLGDMTFCKMEGWDIYEFPRMIRDAVNRCLQAPKQLTIPFV